MSIHAYMACGGKLFRLRRLEVTNRSIRSVLESIKGPIGSEFATEGVCALESPVYLSRGKSLVGANAGDVADVAEVVDSNWRATLHPILTATPEGEEATLALSKKQRQAPVQLQATAGMANQID